MADQHDVVDLRPQLRGWAQEIGRGFFGASKPVLTDANSETLRASFEGLSRNQTFAREIVHDLFPDGCPADLGDFHARVALWDTELPATVETHRLLAALLTQAGQVWPASKDTLLRALASPGQEGFFVMLDALPAFLGENELSANFAAEWFTAIADRLSLQGGGGVFWLGLREFAAHFPERSLQVAELLLNDPQTKNSLAVAARLLGVCRGRELTETETNRVDAISSGWASAWQPEHRRFYNRSWISTAAERALATAEFETLLHRMEQESDKEVEDAFAVVTQCLASAKTGAEVRVRAIAWLREHASSKLGLMAKFYILGFVDEAGDKAAELDDLLCAIQPISVEHENLWHLLQTILVKRLKAGPWTEFVELFKNLADRSGGGFTAAFAKQGLMERLSQKLARDKECADALMADLLFSYDGHRRRLGLHLLQRLPSGTISAAVLTGKKDVEVLLGLLELRCGIFRPFAVAEFLMLIGPYVDTAGAKLKHQYADEVLVQAKSLPRACLERFKAESGKSAIIDKAVPKAEAYVAALKAAGSSPIAEMDVPGFNRAWKEQQRRFRNDVEAGAKQQSIWTRIVPEVHLLYGDKFAIDNGGDSNGTAFKTSYLEAEFPSLEFIDPEGMLLRRILATGAIEQLEDGQAAPEPPPSEPAV